MGVGRTDMLDILFVHTYYERMLGVMTISALLKEHGFTTDVAIGSQDRVIRQVMEQKPRVVGFYCTTGFHHKALSMAREIKQRLGDQVLILCGGPHPTLMPSMIESEGIDILCRGEGEYAVLELLQALRSGSDYRHIQNLIVKDKDGIHENEVRPLCILDDLPRADRELYKSIPYVYRLGRQEVMVGRGCPFDCSFCSNHAFATLYKGKGPYVRKRSIPNAMAELVHVKTTYRPTCFVFYDDTFVLHKDYCIEFFDSYQRQVNVPFTCLIRADLVSEEIVKALSMSGCFLTFFGLETGDEKVRNEILHKNLTDEQIIRCADLLHGYKIPFATFNMGGLPGETLEQFWKTVRLNIKIRTPAAWFGMYQPLPQTRLGCASVAEGHLDRTDVAESDGTFLESSELSRSTEEGQKILRLKNWANLVIRWPFLEPFVDKVAIRLPLDTLYLFLFKCAYFALYFRKLTYKPGLLGTLRMVLFALQRAREFK